MSILACKGRSSDASGKDLVPRMSQRPQQTSLGSQKKSPKLVVLNKVPKKPIPKIRGSPWMSPKKKSHRSAKKKQLPWLQPFSSICYIPLADAIIKRCNEIYASVLHYKPYFYIWCVFLPLDVLPNPKNFRSDSHPVKLPNHMRKCPIRQKNPGKAAAQHVHPGLSSAKLHHSLPHLSVSVNLHWISQRFSANPWSTWTTVA